MRSVPAPEQAFLDLSPLFATLYACIEAAIVKTKTFFEDEGRESIDLSLAPNLVRYFAKEFLQSKGQNVEDVIDMESLANNGLQVRATGYAIRILKADNGNPPTPGASRAKQAFYHQQNFVFMSSDGSTEGGGTNLLLLWDVDQQYNLQQLVLACPCGGDTRRSSVECNWLVPIPHPALSVPADDSDATEDLLLVFRNSEGTGTESGND